MKNINKLIYGDTIDNLKKIKSNTIDMIFADPPYFLSNGKYTVSGGKRNTEKIKKGLWDLIANNKEKQKFNSKWLKQCYRVLKPGGTLWVSGTYHSIYNCGYIIQHIDKNKGFKILNEITWFKPNGAPNISCRVFTASHETLIWARKQKKKKVKNKNSLIFKYLDTKHTFNYNEMKTWDSDKIHSVNKQMRSVWSITNTPPSEKKYGKHSTQKPEKLLERIITASTNKGDLILDPFVGSGTTCVVAKRLSRNYIGIDNSKEYIELAKRRLINTNE